MVTPAQSNDEFPKFSGSRLQPVKLLGLNLSTSIL